MLYCELESLRPLVVYTDALGLSNAGDGTSTNGPRREFQRSDGLGPVETGYDPEIPVNIVDLGLVYSCVITPWSKA